MRGLLIKYGPEGADMQVVGPGYRFANAPGGPDDTVIDYDVATRRLTIRTDLFGVNPVCVLVRDGKLWAADSLARLHDLPETPKGMLPLGACVALCVAPAQRPSVFACGLSVIGGSVIECTPERIRTTPHWGGKPPATGPLDEPKLKASLEQAFARRGGDCGDPPLKVLKGDDWGINEIPAMPVVAEENVPLAFEAAVFACESMLADDAAATNLLLFRAISAGGRKEFVSTVGAGALLAASPELSVGADGLPLFVSRRAEECRVALKLLKPEFARRVAMPDWSELADSDADAARWAYLRTVLLPSEVHEQAHVGAAAGVELRMPFLDRELTTVAFSTSAAALSRRFTATRPALPPPGGVSPRARANWIALYDKWLSGDKLEALEVVDVGVVREFLIAYAKMHSYAPPRVAMDRVLKKLTSLSILRERLG